MCKCFNSSVSSISSLAGHHRSFSLSLAGYFEICKSLCAIDSRMLKFPKIPNGYADGRSVVLRVFVQQLLKMYYQGDLQNRVETHVRYLAELNGFEPFVRVP